MNANDLNILTSSALSPSNAKTSTVTGTGIDLQPYEGQFKVIQDVGTVSGTAPTLDGKIQDSADNSSFADVSGLTFTQVTASTSHQAISVDVRSCRRYIRYVGTIAGTTPSFNVSVLAVGAKKRLGSL